ncbi:MAG: histidine phosphatase family protein [Candidatus Dormibacteria bacterium]
MPSESGDVTPTEQRWPSTLWLVRHGESAGNVARDVAEAERQAVIDIAIRDMDVGLSQRGEGQAEALGVRLRSLFADGRPVAIVSSPYVRAQQTAEIALRSACAQHEIRLDERLREREFGILDRLTGRGIRERYPEQAQARAFLGKFYQRPPGGESWCDVALRLRTVLDTLARDHRGEHVLVVTHEVVVLMFRYLLERLTEAEILAINRERDVANCSLTTFEFDPGRGRHGELRLCGYNDISHLQELGAPITSTPDVPRGPH